MLWKGPADRQDVNIRLYVFPCPEQRGTDGRLLRAFYTLTTSIRSATRSTWRPFGSELKAEGLSTGRSNERS